MTLEELRSRRWGALLRPAASPEQAVAQLTAVQAQDLSMALLAVGLRCPGSRESDVRRALDEGHVLRTHVMRPTWHLVAAEDLRWMVELTGPRVLQAAQSEFRRWGLSDEVRSQARKTLETALASGPVPRKQLVAVLAQKGFTGGGQPVPMFLIDAEQHLVLCSGAGEDPTYDLVDRRVPPAPPLPREEAIARLCLRFLQGHGPATEKDLSWWSGLTVTEVRRGLRAWGARLATDRVGESEFWLDPSGPSLAMAGLGWWPGFDESLMGFADRSALVDPEYWDRVATKNGLFRPFVTFEGRVFGVWRPTSSGVVVEWFEPAPKGGEEAREDWEKRWRVFRGEDEG